jgi:molecular chaperone GrpE
VSTPEKGNTSADNGKGVHRLEDPSAPAEDPAAELESLRAQLELSQAKGREMMERIRDTHERMLRAVADLENYKKRANKEKEEVQKFGNEGLLREFVPVMDNLDRALEHAKSNSDFDSLLAGLAMTRKQFEDALARHGVRSFSAVGQPFDPHLHEAMQHVETTEVPPHHVVSEMVRGYTLNERLVRPALVSVAQPPKDAVAVDSGNGAEPGGGVAHE